MVHSKKTSALIRISGTHKDTTLSALPECTTTQEHVNINHSQTTLNNVFIDQFFTEVES
mgnify:CR=1 FL=1